MPDEAGVRCIVIFNIQVTFYAESALGGHYHGMECKFISIRSGILFNQHVLVPGYKGYYSIGIGYASAIFYTATDIDGVSGCQRCFGFVADLAFNCQISIGVYKEIWIGYFPYVLFHGFGV